jgi:hypothetical protein
LSEEQKRIINAYLTGKGAETDFNTLVNGYEGCEGLKP